MAMGAGELCLQKLRPDIKRGEFSMQEEQTIIQLHALLGNRWSAIATHLPKRTDNEIKNYWNTHLKKRLAKMGIDPSTHKAKSDALSSADGHSRGAANLSHMAQWESARLEAEARLVLESKLRAASSSSNLQQVGSLSSSSSSSTVRPPPAPLDSKSNVPASPPSCLDVLQVWQGVWSDQKPAALIDLESPTSTLSFADNRQLVAGVGLMDGNAAAFSHQEDEILDQESTGWKSMARDRISSFAGFSTEETPWLSEAYAMQGGCTWGQFGAGFTGMLLEDKNSGYCADSLGNGHRTLLTRHHLRPRRQCSTTDAMGSRWIQKFHYNVKLLHPIESPNLLHSCKGLL